MTYGYSISGQYVYFSLIDAASGSRLITGLSGSISGRKTLGLTQSLLSGYVVEIGQGQYALCGFAEDFAAAQVGLLFTAANCVPVNFTIVTDLSASGRFHIASGANAVVPPSTLSGVVANSGLTVTVVKAALSGVVANSGLSVSVPISILSGVVPNVLSGITYPASGVHTVVPRATLSGVVANSGLFVTVPVATISGVYPASGSLSGQLVTLLSGFSYPASGVYTVATATVDKDNISGVFANVPISTVSGLHAVVPPTTLSGVVANSGLTVTVLPSTLSGVVANSGLFVTVPTATISGVIPNVLSGITYPASGVYTVATATVNKDDISGVFANVPITIVSGLHAVVPPATLSGVVANSGLFVNVPINTVSGINAVVPPATLSGLLYIASGQTTLVASGTQVVIASGSMSGQLLTLLSGFSYPASGISITVPPATLSGVFTNVPIATISGVNAVVPKETLSGVVVNSGLFVTVPIATISGPNVVVPIATISGVNAVVPKETLSGVVANSGLFVVATATVASGDVYLASGHNLFWSGGLYIASGPNVVVVKETISGVVANSGLFVTVPKATISGVVTNSGLFVTATATVASGDVYLASGHNLFWSGELYGASGVFAVVPIATISGVNAVVPKETLSGVVVNSGLFVTVPIATVSGAVPNVLSGTVWIANGSLGSGAFVSGLLTQILPQGILTYNYSGAPNVSGQRNLLNATRKLINAWDAGVTSSGVLTVFQEDDATIAYTQDITAASGADPISSLTTNG